VQLVAVDEWVLSRPEVRTRLGEAGILDEQRRGVDADAGNAALEPEPQDVLVLGPHVRVLPVEVRLLGREQVQVPLPVADARPGPSPEVRLPAVWRQLARRAHTRPEPEALAGSGAGSRGERVTKPGVLARDVIRNDVDDRADAKLARLVDQPLRLPERSERRIDRAVIGDVVPRVGQRRRVPRVEPQRVHTECGQVAQLFPHPGEVTDPVTVRVTKAADVDLVDDRLPPPGRPVPGLLGHQHGAQVCPPHDIAA
jgi:hypothetical protein